MPQHASKGTHIFLVSTIPYVVWLNDNIKVFLHVSRILSDQHRCTTKARKAEQKTNAWVLVDRHLPKAQEHIQKKLSQISSLALETDFSKFTFPLSDSLGLLLKWTTPEQQGTPPSLSTRNLEASTIGTWHTLWKNSHYLICQNQLHVVSPLPAWTYPSYSEDSEMLIHS